MMQDDIDYYRGRERQELLAADQAPDASCRMVHVEMARLYAQRLAELGADQFDVVEEDEIIGLSSGQIIS